MPNTQSASCFGLRCFLRAWFRPVPAALRVLLPALILLLCGSSVFAQLQQAFVFSADLANPSSIDVYTRNDVTGVLTPVAGSPFPSREPVNFMTLDFKGRFLFTASLNSSKISMFTVNANTGALQEVSSSPFASASTNQPIFLSTESSGQFLYVIDLATAQPDTSAVETFQIDPVNLDLVPSSSSAASLPGLFLNGATHPSGMSFYAFLTVPNGAVANEAVFLLFDSSNGTFTSQNLSQINPPTSVGTIGCCLALAAQGGFLALGMSGSSLVYSLNSDGTLAPNPSGGEGVFNGDANSISFDDLGQFLYVDISKPGTADAVHIFGVPTLLELADSPLPSGFPFPGTWNVDPTAPLIYADQVYQIAPQTGVPSAILSTNPLGLAGSGVPHAVFSQPPGSQPVTGPIAQLSTAAISFGTLSLGQTSSAQTLTITSNGGQALDLNTLMITGANPGDFSETDTCHVPAVLQPGQSCSALVSFAPSAPGPRSAALTLTDNAAPPTESVALSGTGQTPAPAITFVPGSLSFGNVVQGSSSSLVITVNNSGTAVLNITNIVLGGANPSDYSSSSPTCNSPIAVNSACTVNVTFTPQAPGLRSATLTFTDNAPDSPQTLALSGTGAATGIGISISPADPSFPTITEGTSGAAQTLTVTNSGTGILHISAVSLAGTNPSDFALTNNCKSPVSAAANCTISLAFSPLGPGQRTANLSITDDAPGSPQTIALTATANPAFTSGPAPGGSTTVSISAGQTAQFQLQLTPGPGYGGSVALACSGAPTAATCQVPASVSIANGTPAPFTVTVPTSGSALLPLSTHDRFGPPAEIRLLLLLFLAFLLMIVGGHQEVFHRSFEVKRLAWSGALAAILLCCVTYADGCGGGSSGSSASVNVAPPPGPVTPSGTSTIIVTPTATSLTGQPLQLTPIQLTLTVN